MPLSRTHKGGFSLVELLVSLAILSILLLLVVSMTDMTRRAWTTSATKVEQFRDAREAFESISRRLSQATLNTYWDYHYPNDDMTQAPDRYIRQSELRFLCGNATTLLPSLKDPNGNSVTTASHAVFFQAPIGYVDAPASGAADFRSLNNILNTCGYFIEFGSDKSSWPAFLQTMSRPVASQQRYRFRLMELVEPSNTMTLYTYTSGTNPNGSLKATTYTQHDWFTAPLSASPAPVRVVAENIVAMVILPKLTPQEDTTGARLAPSYAYDSASPGAAASLTGTAAAAVNSKNQLPPIIQLTVVAVDEASYARFQATQGESLPSTLGLAGLFQTVGDTANSANPGYARDLQTLQTILQAHRINYRVFTTNIAISSAKWSRDQAD